jgi:hypothetical protein
MKKIKWDWEKIGRLIPYLVLLGAFLFSVGIYAYLGTHNLDSDQSSDMVMAQLLKSIAANSAVIHSQIFLLTAITLS